MFLIKNVSTERIIVTYHVPKDHPTIKEGPPPFELAPGEEQLNMGYQPGVTITITPKDRPNERRRWDDTTNYLGFDRPNEKGN